MKKNKTIPFVKGFILIFLLVVFPTWPLLLGQEVRKYPLYPDIWIREFVDYMADRLYIYPIGENEVLISQPLKEIRTESQSKTQEGIQLTLWRRFFSTREQQLN